MIAHLKDNWPLGFWSGMFLACVFGAGMSFGAFCERQKAVEASAGRWTVDPQTGKTEFRYGPQN